MFCLTYHVSTQMCRLRRVKRRISAHFWVTKTWLRVTFNISHRVLHLTSHWCAWNDGKPHDYNLRTILRMQLLKYETTFENISLTDAKTMVRVHCKKTSLYATFSTYIGVYVCKFTHRRTCLYTTWNLNSYVSPQMCQQRDVFMHTFWLMKTRLCVTFNT